MGQKVGNPIIWNLEKQGDFFVFTEDVSCHDGPVYADMLSFCKMLNGLLGEGWAAGDDISWANSISIKQDLKKYAKICDLYGPRPKGPPPYPIENIFTMSDKDWRWFYRADFDCPHQIFLKNEEDAVSIRLVI